MENYVNIAKKFFLLRLLLKDNHMKTIEAFNEICSPNIIFTMPYPGYINHNNNEIIYV